MIICQNSQNVQEHIDRLDLGKSIIMTTEVDRQGQHNNKVPGESTMINKALHYGARSLQDQRLALNYI